MLDSSATHELAPVKGRAFCFLPLPAETGLPVHVNGYFELSSNRRDIWRGDDLAGEGRTRAEWNKALLEGVVAPTYARLLLRLAATITPVQLDWYYSMWPSSAASEPWVSLARRVYIETHALSVLYSAVGGGRWVAPRHALYVKDAHAQADAVRDALLSDSKDLVRVPTPVLRLFDQVALGLLEASPSWVREYLKDAPLQAAWRQKHSVHVDLLQFCLSDFVLGAPPDSNGGAMYAQLCGLSIVPGASGTSLTFAPPTSEVACCVLVATAHECRLLAAVQGDLVDPALPEEMMAHMHSDAMGAYTNVKVVTPELLSECLHRVLPRGWKGTDEVQWGDGGGGGTRGGGGMKGGGGPVPDGEWMRQFWEYAGESEHRVAAFYDWPLLPTCEGSLCLLTTSGGQGTKVVDGEAVLGHALKSVLARLGVRILDGTYMGEGTRQRLSRLVQQPTLRGVLRALGVANKGSFEHVCERIGMLNLEDKRQLRSFFLQPQWMVRAECSAEGAAMVLALPLHELCSHVPCTHDPAPESECIAVDIQKLPPAGVMAALLTPTFLKGSEEESEAYRFLGT